MPMSNMGIEIVRVLQTRSFIEFISKSLILIMIKLFTKLQVSLFTKIV